MCCCCQGELKPERTETALRVKIKAPAACTGPGVGESLRAALPGGAGRHRAPAPRAAPRRGQLWSSSSCGKPLPRGEATRPVPKAISKTQTLAEWPLRGPALPGSAGNTVSPGSPAPLHKHISVFFRSGSMFAALAECACGAMS